MRISIYITLLIFVLQATFGLMAHCSSALDIEVNSKSQEMEMHHAMQSNDSQDSDSQHDCCDDDNKSKAQFSDTCDCDSGVIHAIVSLDSLAISNYSVQYFFSVAISLATPKSFLLLRPPIAV